MTVSNPMTRTHVVRHGALDIALVVSVGASPALEPRLAGRLVLGRIELGLCVEGRVLGRGAALMDVRRREVREEYHMVTGKAVGLRHVDHSEAILTMADPDGSRWQVIVRAADDGLAFRYVLPDSDGPTNLGEELTRYVLKDPARAWVLDYQPWYETPRFGTDITGLPPGEYGFPLLLTCEGSTFALLSESDIDGRSSGAHVRFDAEAFQVVTADTTTLIESGHRTPWRVAILGDLRQIVSSTLVDDLAPPARGASLADVRPGRAAWSWWSSGYSGAYLDVQKRFADSAATQGWEHLLVDCGWDETWVPELVSYASARGIQVHLWSTWTDLDGAGLDKLALWRSWGVAGIKVDFMESESQDRYRWYDAILAETARVGLMVNFHGSVIPRGWARTYPHVMTYEAIRGAEYYTFYDQPLSASHNVIQPFTRNVVGSMDYTPVTFSAPRRETSDGHELALSVVFESGITHFADDPAEYVKRPLAARFLAELPTSWNETRLLDGHPDRAATIARRHDDRWFVGCICATDGGDQTLSLAELSDGGPVDIWLITDAPDGGLVELRMSAVTESSLRIAVVKNGGFVAVVTPANRPVLLSTPRPLSKLPRIGPPVSTIDDQGHALLRVDPDATLRVPPGWTGKKTGREHWTVCGPTVMRPGQIAVITAERQVEGSVVVVAHARVTAPLTEGEHPLSALPFLACTNGLGPVERDMSNGGGDPRDGGVLTVAGTPWTSGLGVANTSQVEFHLGGAARELSGAVGIDDEAGGTATAIIVVDGAPAYEVTVAAGHPAVTFKVDVRGARTLELRTRTWPGSPEAHVDWLAPFVNV